MAPSEYIVLCNVYMELRWANIIRERMEAQLLVHSHDFNHLPNCRLGLILRLTQLPCIPYRKGEYVCGTASI